MEHTLGTKISTFGYKWKGWGARGRLKRCAKKNLNIKRGKGVH